LRQQQFQGLFDILKTPPQATPSTVINLGK
jgi:hypothetical protein